MTFPRSWYRPGRYYRPLGVIIALWALYSPPGRYYRPRALLSPSGRYYRFLGVIIASGAILSPCDYRPGPYSQGDNNAPEAIITPWGDNNILRAIIKFRGRQYHP